MYALKDKLPAQVTVVEVGPRDGLQDEQQILATDIKVEFIDRLSQTGLQRIEVTSFVHPRRVPQLADAESILKSINRYPGVEYSALVPNEKCLQRAMRYPPTKMAVFTATTDAFTRENINCSIEESLLNFSRVVETAAKDSIAVRGYISCCWGCPYEGKVDKSQVLHVARRLQTLGCEEIVLADTIGIATPLEVQDLVQYISQFIPLNKLALHFHDSRGQALANVLAALQVGIRIFDSSVAGLGGCPYSPGAGGNLATEDLLYMLHGMNIHTGIDLQAVIDTGRFISQYFTQNNSRTGIAGLFHHGHLV